MMEAQRKKGGQKLLFKIYEESSADEEEAEGVDEEEVRC
jgi:hypothetical protein